MGSGLASITRPNGTVVITMSILGSHVGKASHQQQAEMLCLTTSRVMRLGQARRRGGFDKAS